MNWKQINTAYPFEHSFVEKRNTIITISIFTSVLIFLLQPFGIITTSAVDMFFHFIGFLIISITILSVNYFGFPYYFPKLFNDKKWSIVKGFSFLVFNFLIIGFWNHIFISWANNDIEGFVSLWELSRWIFQTLAIGVISSGFLILFRFNILARTYLQISQDLNEQLQEQLKFHKINGVKENKFIELQLENKPMIFNSSDLKYISAEGNYVAINYDENGIAKKKIFRNTITQLEKSLLPHVEFFRCHRSYLINLDAIQGTQGNSQGLFVKLNSGDVKIPVARSKIKTLRQQLDHG